MTVPTILSKKSAEKVVEFLKHSTTAMQANWSVREKLTSLDLQYMRETDRTVEQRKAKAANQAGDVTKFQNIVVPVVMPQIENAVTYQQSVFLSGYPIFSCVSLPEFAEEANQIDTIMGEHSIHANWVVNLLQALRDGFKYNLMAVEVDWAQERTAVATAGTTETKVVWEGNKIKRLDLYNTFWDTRVKPSEVAEVGEFAGYHELKGRLAFKQFVANLPIKSKITEAMDSAEQPIDSGQTFGNYGNFYFPLLNPSSLIARDKMGTFNWGAWAGYEKSSKGMQYKDYYLVTTLYARILPSDFDIVAPAKNTPQIWKFYIVNNQVVIYAERMTNAHNMLPIVFAQPLDDGLGYQTKSMTETVEPFQSIISAFANATMAAQRRGISDRKLYDPSRISPAAINNDNPNANIAVRPSAYGQELSKAVYAFPFQDSQFQYNQANMQGFLAMANQATGLNPARQGQFVKGNKTKFEYADVMSNANGRDMTVSLMLEGGFFTPVKKMLLTNILQYQGQATVPNPMTGEVVAVDPVALSKATIVMKVTDGLTPSDKIIDGDTLTQAVQLLMSDQGAISSEFNMGDMVSYLFSSRGAKLGTFKKSPQQVAYEGAVGQWQQTLQMIAQQFASGQATPEQVQQMLQSVPQPTPEQFGYVPGTKKLTAGAATSNSPSILGTITQTIQAAQTAEQGANNAPPAE
jgi:hypothetical protein